MTKRFAAFILILVMAFSATTVPLYADYTDIPENAAYKNAVDRMTSLGIMEGTRNSTYKPDNILSREQFLKILLTAAELSDKAEAMNGETAFSDIGPKDWISGYVNLALSKGFIRRTSDNRFNPHKDITFGDACTMVVHALGFEDKDLKGAAPDLYVRKAKELGLTEGISLRSNDGVPKWAVTVLIDKFWMYRVKEGEVKDLDRVFNGNSSLYIECVVLGDSRTSPGMSEKQVLTDKGVFTIQDPAIRLQVGNTYRVIADGNRIIKASDRVYSVLTISVENAVDTNVSYKYGDIDKTMILPESTDYYYKGKKQNYEDLKNILRRNTAIIFTWNETETGYKYAVVCDPIYSKPQIARNFNPSEKRLGKIDFSGNPTIVKNGEPVDISLILNGDVVYEVSDVWNKSRYILVIDKKVGGKTTAILPDKLSPKTIEIDGNKYDLDKDIDPNVIVGAASSLKMGDNIIISLGHDGKIVDIHYPGSEDDSNYAFVINVSYDMSRKDTGQIEFSYYAKLLLDSGITTTYKVTGDPAQLAGKIVRYRIVDNQTAELEQLIYNFPDETYINKGDRKLGDSDITDNVKIFDVVSDDGGEVQVRLLDWSELPDGTVKKGKLLYSNKTGVFEDINILLTNDILEEKYRSAVVQKKELTPGSNGTFTFKYTLLVDGKTYEYKDTDLGVYAGSVLEVRMSGTGVSTVSGVRKADVTATGIQAVNGKKIKVENMVYRFKNNITVYYKDLMNNVTVKTLGDIDTSRTYSEVALYSGSNSHGKIEVIIMRE